MGADERELLLQAFDSNWIAPTGPQVDAFEHELASVIGAAGAAALSSGTAALHLALLLLGVSPGDTVVTSTLTFVATANAIRYVGATPIFIDSDRASWNMDPDLLEEELHEAARRGELPKAVLVVDLYGQCANYTRIRPICERHGIPIIEDAAEALGASHQGKPAGLHGELGAFSFNGNKIITTSGGGMLVSANLEWLSRARFLASQAREAVAHYEHLSVGYNYRMSNLLAAVGRGQLRHLEGRVARRREHNAYYRAALSSALGVEFMPEAEGCHSTFWLTALTIDPDVAGVTSTDICRLLETHDIEARPVWKPMHLQPLYGRYQVRRGDVANELYERGLCLPSGSSLTDQDRERVASLVLGTLHR
jgi:dTDP-4-amino-4,6-dideoxygalactose transaminase